jgi:chemotaxis family two-component system response regulator Rcp1
MSNVAELLIVDDNPADIALACEAFAASKYDGRINTVIDGEEALAFLNRSDKYANAMRPDLVMLDLNLPKKSGRAVLTALKADPELRRIPVVVFSTSTLSSDITGCYALGANCYVSKPGSLNEYLSTIKSIEEFWFGRACLPPRGE